MSTTTNNTTSDETTPATTHTTPGPHNVGVPGDALISQRDVAAGFPPGSGTTTFSDYDKM